MWDWDEAKRQANLAKHGVDFRTMAGFDWTTADTRTDLRRDYGEVRFFALGMIGDRLHAVAYTERDGRQRIISLRKANRREFEEWTNRAP
jgi:uncharacterized DUF497 family protein